MRFFLKQLDTTQANRDGAEKVKNDLNESVRKIEGDGNVVVGEDFMPQQNNIRSILLLKYEKGKSEGLKYSFLILDSRNGYDVAGKMLNAETISLEKNGRDVIRATLVPMKNDMYTQLIIAHVPVKGVKTVVVPKEVPKEEVKDNGKEETDVPK